MKIAILSGDGIGPEIMEEALKVLKALGQKYHHSFEFKEGFIGGIAFEKTGTHFPRKTQEICASSDAILFGSVGGPFGEAHKPKWKNCEINSILTLRKTFNFHANFRPIKTFKELGNISPLKERVLGEGLDILIVRELTSGIYFGEHKEYLKNNIRIAQDQALYTEEEIRAVAHRAFAAAQTRRKKVTSVDKANVLSTSKLWRKVVSEVAETYADIQLEHMFVDNASMQLIQNPAQFDVLLTDNLFGDILSDAASAIPGSLGLTPSASLNAKGFGLYEPAGGSAPSLAGKNIANPIGQILSAAMMLRLSFSLEKEAQAIEKAIQETLREGYRTADISPKGNTVIGTREMAEEIIKRVNLQQR
jgi:3-isopropylmalate dehydrogenase